MKQNEMKPLVLKRLQNMISSENLPTVITHKNCMDGTGSVLAIADLFDVQPSDLNVKFCQYGDDLSEILYTTHENVIMADFSFSQEELLQLDDNCDNLVVIDHHKTAEDALKDLPFTHFNMNESGATLTYLCIASAMGIEDIEIPILLKQIRARDIWTWDQPNAKEVSAGLQLLGTRDIDALMKYMNNTTSLEESGATVLAYQNQQVSKATYRYGNDNPGRLISYGDIMVPFVNTTTLISEIGNELSKDWPFAIMFFITDDSIVLSFRSSDDNPDAMDVSAIAKEFGGGGHIRSSGASFKLADNPHILNQLLIDGVLNDKRRT